MICFNTTSRLGWFGIVTPIYFPSILPDASSKMLMIHHDLLWFTMILPWFAMIYHNSTMILPWFTVVYHPKSPYLPRSFQVVPAAQLLQAPVALRGAGCARPARPGAVGDLGWRNMVNLVHFCVIRSRIGNPNIMYIYIYIHTYAYYSII